MVYFNGYHGTNNACVEGILKEGINPSVGEDEWLGDGAYFFLKGLSSRPEQQAEQWAIVSAWDNDLHANKYDCFSVLKADIAVDESWLLDLTTPEGQKIFTYIKNQCIHKLRRTLQKRKINIIDGYLIDFGRNEMSLRFDIVKGNVYIKLSKDERILRLHSRIPNCTIGAVYNPDCITTITNIKTGKI